MPTPDDLRRFDERMQRFFAKHGAWVDLALIAAGAGLLLFIFVMGYKLGLRSR